MSAPAFTPGPWEARGGIDDGWFVDTAPGVKSANGYVIADDIIGHDAEANASLIAAAPELYEALEGLLAEFVDAQQGLEQFKSAIVRKSVERAQAAIAKARGQ